MKRYSIILALILLSGCNSNDDDSTCTKAFTGVLDANEEVLIGTWQLTAITAGVEVDITDDGENNPSDDIYSQSDECRQDLSFAFSADRSLTYSQGTTATDCGSWAGSSSGTWQFTGQVLNLEFSCIVQPNNLVVNATEDQFTISYNNVTVKQADGSEVVTQVIYTYSKS